jgi:hypothetical protein
MKTSILTKLSMCMLIGSLSACGGGGGAGTTPSANAVANAGGNQNVAMSANVILDGSGSSDADGDLLTYKWSQISGPDVTGGSGGFSGESPAFVAPDTAATLQFQLVVNDGYGDSTPSYVTVDVLGPPVSNVVVDPTPTLPVNKTSNITASLLAAKFNDAFQQVLNSPNDNITLSIEGKVQLPIDIPILPPGILNGGIDVSKTVQITAVQDNQMTYYDVSFEKDAGISFGAGVPELPAGDEVSGDVTTSFSHQQVFRFKSPSDAATGMMDYFVLKGLWQAMNGLSVIGINTSDLNTLLNNFRDYVSKIPGLNLSVNASQLQGLLSTAQAGLPVAQKAVSDAQSLVSGAEQVLSTLQNYIYNTFTFFGLPVPNLVQQQLNNDQDALNNAQNALNEKQAKLDALNQQITTYQNELAVLPAGTSISVVDYLVNYIENGVSFLNQAHTETELKISRKTAVAAKADLLGGVDADRTMSIAFNLDAKTQDITVKMSFSGEHSVDANLGLVSSLDKGSVQETNEIEYDLVFKKDPQTQAYALNGKGTFTLDADLKGSISKGGDALNRSVDVGITPTLKFTPGQELTQFGENATDVIDLSPIIGVVGNLKNSTADDLIQAVTATVQSFQIDNLVTAISEMTLPLKIKVYGGGGIDSEITAGNDEVLKGTLKLSAGWQDYGNTIDLSSMTIGDFANNVLSNNGITTNLDKLVTALKSAYSQLN